MKAAIIVFLFILSTNIVQAQIIFRTYHKNNNAETKNLDEALYYREIAIAEDQSLIVTERYISTDKTKLYGHYNNIKEKKFVGQKFQAYSNGKIKAKEKYSFDAILIDTAEYYHYNGKLKIAYNYPYQVEKEKTKVTDTLILLFQDSLGNRHLVNGNGYAELYIESNTGDDTLYNIEKGNFQNHKKTGEWTGKFLNGKYTFIEQYEDGQLIKGVSMDSAKNVYNYDAKNAEIPPIYPGGLISLRQYIANNYSYPKKALQEGIDGTVIISFNIDSKGRMVDLKIDQDLGFGTGEEAIRVARSTKAWKPGIMRGVPVKVAYILPIRLNTM